MSSEEKGKQCKIHTYSDYQVIFLYKNRLNFVFNYQTAAFASVILSERWGEIPCNTNIWSVRVAINNETFTEPKHWVLSLKLKRFPYSSTWILIFCTSRSASQLIVEISKDKVNLLSFVFFFIRVNHS